MGPEGTAGRVPLAVGGSRPRWPEALANPSGKIGTQVSPARFKQDIQDMGAASSGLLELRPVTGIAPHLRAGA